MFCLALIIMLHSICRMYCKASVFDRRIFERLWKGASDCAGLIFINCQFWCIFRKFWIFSEICQNVAWYVFSDMFVCCAAFLCFHCSLWLLILVVVLYCTVVLFSVLCNSVCLVLSWFHPSAHSLGHQRSLLTSSRLVLAWPCLALICHVLFCSCRFRLLLPTQRKSF